MMTINPLNEEAGYKIHDVAEGMNYYLGGIFCGIEWKALVASVPAAFSTYFGGDWGFLETWLILNFIDLVFGVILALKTSTFSRSKLYGWVIKTLTHMCTILVFGVVTVMLAGLTGYATPLIDWFVFILVLTEAASILQSADKLGMPVHPLARIVVNKLRRRVETKIKKMADIDKEEPSHD